METTIYNKSEKLAPGDITMVIQPCDVKPLLEDRNPKTVVCLTPSCASCERTCHKSTCCLSSLSPAIQLLIWCAALVGIVYLFVWSFHCNDDILAARGKHVDISLKGAAAGNDINNKPGCYVNANTAPIMFLHLAGGTVIILFFSCVASFCVNKHCHY